VKRLLGDVVGVEVDGAERLVRHRKLLNTETTRDTLRGTASAANVTLIRAVGIGVSTLIV
jgi:hypothetical protein